MRITWIFKGALALKLANFGARDKHFPARCELVSLPFCERPHIELAPLCCSQWELRLRSLYCLLQHLPWFANKQWTTTGKSLVALKVWGVQLTHWSHLESIDSPMQCTSFVHTQPSILFLQTRTWWLKSQLITQLAVIASMTFCVNISWSQTRWRSTWMSFFKAVLCQTWTQELFAAAPATLAEQSVEFILQLVRKWGRILHWCSPLGRGCFSAGKRVQWKLFLLSLMLNSSGLCFSEEIHHCALPVGGQLWYVPRSLFTHQSNLPRGTQTIFPFPHHNARGVFWWHALQSVCFDYSSWILRISMRLTVVQSSCSPEPIGFPCGTIAFLEKKDGPCCMRNWRHHRGHVMDLTEPMTLSFGGNDPELVFLLIKVLRAGDTQLCST